MLSVGREGKDFWDSWQLADSTMEDQDVPFAKYQTNLIGTQNKWFMGLELSIITQQTGYNLETNQNQLVKLAVKKNYYYTMDVNSNK